MEQRQLVGASPLARAEGRGFESHYQPGEGRTRIRPFPLALAHDVCYLVGAVLRGRGPGAVLLRSGDQGRALDPPSQRRDPGGSGSTPRRGNQAITCVASRAVRGCRRRRARTGSHGGSETTPCRARPDDAPCYDRGDRAPRTWRVQPPDAPCSNSTRGGQSSGLGRGDELRVAPWIRILHRRVRPSMWLGSQLGARVDSAAAVHGPCTASG